MSSESQPPPPQPPATVPESFWDDVASGAPRVWLVTCIGALCGSILALAGDYTDIRPDLRPLGLAARGASIAAFATGIWLARNRATFVRRHYQALMFAVFPAVAIPVTLNGALAAEHGNLYWFGILQLDLAASTFFLIPARLFLTGAWLSTAAYVAVRLGFATRPLNVEDANVVIGLVIFGILASITHHVILSSRRENHTQRRALQEAKGTLEERVQTRTQALEDATQRLTENEAELRSLAGELLVAREEERTSVAQDIHDDLGQVLSLIRMDLAWVRNHPGMPSEELAKRHDALLGTTDEALGSVRRIAAALRPPVLDDGGLARAFDWQCREFSKRTSVTTSLAVDLPPEIDATLDAQVATTLFRVLQESLTNVARHAAATDVVVELNYLAGVLTLRVRDDGVGMNAGQVAGRRPLGILGMRERALAIGGTLAIGAGPTGLGTEVVMTIPNVAQTMERAT